MQEYFDNVRVRASKSLLKLEVSLQLGNILTLADVSTKDRKKVIAQSLLVERLDLVT